MKEYIENKNEFTRNILTCLFDCPGNWVKAKNKLHENLQAESHFLLLAGKTIKPIWDSKAYARWVQAYNYFKVSHLINCENNEPRLYSLRTVNRSSKHNSLDPHGLVICYTYALPRNFAACISAERASSRRPSFFSDSALRNQLSGSTGLRRIASSTWSRASIMPAAAGWWLMDSLPSKIDLWYSV